MEYGRSRNSNEFNALVPWSYKFPQPEPCGVVAAISAFNHPTNLIIHQVVPAVAVGAPIIVKPAETTRYPAFEFLSCYIKRVCRRNGQKPFFVIFLLLKKWLRIHVLISSALSVCKSRVVPSLEVSTWSTLYIRTRWCSTCYSS